ncbi:MAG TPA: hypothetical protein PLN63_05315 [Paludibacteraceae bacterium]|nr:hypothetical protein [Paludibacteraceae bacterium]HOU68020.1 hypothetical protein [Paludibacteraceae bacterium]HPH63019.1 hypothetical protein [Paludibacteraceae bacterium]HQF49945.1 hypothetical protein [Paludibacteraceae bacterium]HQJ90516.1 hypothetical protein [Paludibacteraceae bacterium]
MSWDLISSILNILLGGGCVLSLFKLKAERKAANAEAKGKELENEGKTLQMQMEYIIEPLKKEINGLRKDVRKLQKAIDRIGDCPYGDACPVRKQLQNEESDSNE